MSDEAERIKALSERLQGIASASEPGNDEPPEWVLANDLVELADAFDESAKRIRALETTEQREEMVDLLTELREDIRHLAWHLASPQFRDAVEAQIRSRTGAPDRHRFGRLTGVLGVAQRRCEDGDRHVGFPGLGSWFPGMALGQNRLSLMRVWRWL